MLRKRRRCNRPAVYVRLVLRAESTILILMDHCRCKMRDVHRSGLQIVIPADTC